MVRSIYFDKVLFTVFLTLILLGGIFVYSAVLVKTEYVKYQIILRKELIIIFIGIFLMLLTYLIPIKFWKKIAYPFAFFILFLLIVVLIIPSSGVKRWISLGFFNIQPSEFAKLAVVLFISFYIYKKGDGEIPEINKVIALFSFPAFVSFLVLLEPHKGAAIFIFLLSLALIFSTNIKLRYILGLLIIGAPIFVYKIMSSNYAKERLMVFIHPFSHSEHSNQVIQSLVSFAKGGFVGEGIGAGIQKLYYLAEIHTDYILALIGEETGFLGVSFLILLYLIVFIRGIQISTTRSDTFTQLFGLGVTYLLTFQALFHMLVNVGLFPPTGFTLPFISYGGSSFLVSCISAGILLRISKEPIKSIWG